MSADSAGALLHDALFDGRRVAITSIAMSGLGFVEKIDLQSYVSVEVAIRGSGDLSVFGGPVASLAGHTAWIFVQDHGLSCNGLAVQIESMLVTKTGHSLWRATCRLYPGDKPTPAFVDTEGFVRTTSGMLGRIAQEGKGQKMKAPAKTRLECTTGGHSKFYEVEVGITSSPYVLTKRWGRIGTAGQEKVEEFVHYQHLLEAADKVIAERLAKGYKNVTPPDQTISAPDDGQYWKQKDGTLIRPRDMADQHLRNAVAMLLKKAGGTVASASAQFPNQWAMLRRECERRGSAIVAEEVAKIAAAAAAEVTKKNAERDAALMRKAEEVAARKRAAALADPFGDEAPRKFSI